MATKIGFAADLDVPDHLIREFYEENWPRKIALCDAQFYHWQFTLPPDNAGKDCCVVGYDQDQKKVLGVMGLNKRKFYLGGGVLDGAELTTWVVSKENPVAGLGARILLYIQSNFEMLIGMGISNMALPIYMRCGFRYLKAIPRFVKVVNFEQIKKHAQFDYLGEMLVRMWKPTLAEDFLAEDFLAEPFTQAGFRSAEHFLVGINHFARSSEHLNWRYANHPYFTYKQFLVRENDLASSSTAYVAMREEASLSEFSVLHIMDMFGEQASLHAAVRFVHSYAIKHHFDVIDFYCTSSKIYRHLLARGWFSINDDTCFSFPHLFHPVEIRNPPTTSLIYWARDGMTDLADISNLYITKQDADLDRPTGHTLSTLRKGD